MSKLPLVRNDTSWGERHCLLAMDGESIGCEFTTMAQTYRILIKFNHGDQKHTGMLYVRRRREWNTQTAS